MIAMPIFALEEVPKCKPRDVSTRISLEGRLRMKMTHTVDKTLAVECEHEAERTQPEECRRAKPRTTEKRYG